MPTMRMSTGDLSTMRALSFKARGLLIYLLSKPQDWRVSSKQLAKASPQGITAIRSAMKELVACGYARLQTIQGEDGRLSGRLWTISDLPCDDTESQVF